MPRVSARARQWGRVVAVALSLALPLMGGAAAGQPNVAESDASARADALNKRAVEALKRDAYAEAEPLARQAWSLKQAYDIASNLGLAELGLRRHREAAEHLSFALRTFPANGKAEHKRLVEQSLARATAEVGAVEVTVSVDGAAVFADDRRVGTAPLRDPVYLEPGPHVLRAELPGYAVAKQPVNAERGRSTTLRLTLDRSSSPLPTASASVEPPPRKSVPLIVAGFGVAATGVAIGVGGMVASSSNSSTADSLRQKLSASGGDSACNLPANAKDCADLQTSLKNVGTFRNVGIVGLAVGGLALAGTLVYLAVPTGGAQQPVTTGVALGPDGARLSIRGKF